MTGTFITIEHRCVLPEIKENMGVRTVWQCECGMRYWINCLNFVDRFWNPMHENDWIESENRMKTREESFEERMAQAIANDPAKPMIKNYWWWQR
jgi:hypothetical protein